MLDLQHVVRSGVFSATSMDSNRAGGDGGSIMGLSGLVKAVFGMGLNKTAQMSDWQLRPLHPQQVRMWACFTPAVGVVIACCCR